MSSNYLSGLVLGAFVTVLVLVLLVMVAKWVRNLYFPKETPEQDSAAMMEILQLKAKLEKEAAEAEKAEREGQKKKPEQDPEDGSESSGHQG